MYSPEVSVTLVVAFLVWFQRWRTWMYRSWVAVVTLRWPDLGLSLALWVVLHRAHKAEMVGLEMPNCLATVCWVAPACNLAIALLSWCQSWHYCITCSVLVRSVWITAEVAFYIPLTEGSAYKVIELRDAHASLRVVFLAFQYKCWLWLCLCESDVCVCVCVWVGGCYSVFASPFTHFDFIYDVFDSVKK